MSKPTLKVTKDFTKQFNDAVKKFQYDKVLVGIPEDTDARKETGEDQMIGNAALLAIANFGSPMNNIPPWPIMAIGIRNAQDSIAEQFKVCAQKVLSSLVGGSSGLDAMDTYYNRAGLIASTSVKKVINSQEDVPPNKPSDATMRSRKAIGFKGDKYWLVTGQMRNAITYVVRGR
ncbi:MAG: hypothetical protein OEW15_11635 [Nitrospirota bacterium]|nr:hypothetical protein [Nitrospirota bacterium]